MQEIAGSGERASPTIWAEFVALNGSERIGGNTSDVLAHLVGRCELRGVRLTVIDLATHEVAACGACGDCNAKLSACEVRDDVPDIVARMVEADGIIYASPVHGFGLSSVMQRFVERAGVGYLRFDRPLTNKVAGVVVTGRRYSHGEVHAQLVNNVMLNRMLLAGSGFPAVVHAGARGTAVADVEGMAAVENMVDRMIDLQSLLVRHRELTGGGLPIPATNERGR